MNQKYQHCLTLGLLTLSLLFASLIYPTYTNVQAQGPNDAWIIWEMSGPQRLLRISDTVWVGTYKDGLVEFDTASGFQARYGAADGLLGQDVVGLEAQASGLWLATLDGGLIQADSLTNTTGLTFTTLSTPLINPWHVVADNNGTTWVASLGSGVGAYNNNAWTVYNYTNSTLPFDDIYALALDGNDQPWVGTIGYGLANWTGTAWQTRTVPVNIDHPVKPDQVISNNAILDMAFDASGQAYIATDGSGLAVLDPSSETWTIYNQENSPLPNNFVCSLAMAEQTLWLGTLGGGVAQFDTQAQDWTVLNTQNSPLPDDDVLDIIIDDQGGRWFATFDQGLTYNGPLPDTPPHFAVNLFTEPDRNPGEDKGYALWLDPETYIWTLALSGDGEAHTFTGEIIVDTGFVSATPHGLEAGDSVTVNGNTLTVTATEAISDDQVRFVLDRQATEMTLNLKIDGAYRPFNIHLGEAGTSPATAPFRLTPPQPQPPQVDLRWNGYHTLPLTQTFIEGEDLFLTSLLTDTDSPLDHHLLWQMGDGTTYSDTLSVLHRYRDEGVYPLSLTATDIHGEISTDTLTLTVLNAPPFINFVSEPFRPEPGQTITFTGSVDDAGVDDRHSYLWDFGDGNTSTTGLTVTHHYATIGSYVVTLQATDNAGATASTSNTIEIAPFQANFFGYPSHGTPPITATYFDTSSGVVTDRIWHFGDGSTSVVTTATVIDHAYTQPGIYDVGLTINGPSGQSTYTETAALIVTNRTLSESVTIEAEAYDRHIARNHVAWQTRDQRAGYHGTGYVQALPTLDQVLDFGEGAELQYALNIVTTGTYTIWLRGYSIGASSDSLYVGLNGTALTTTSSSISGFAPRQWGWRNSLVPVGQAATLDIATPDIYLLNIWMREDGFSLDQIIITQESDFAPPE